MNVFVFFKPKAASPATAVIVANLAKKVSVTAVVAVAEAAEVAADKMQERKEKSRKVAIETLKELESLKQQGLITEEEFQKKRKQLVKKI